MTHGRGYGVDTSDSCKAGNHATVRAPHHPWTESHVTQGRPPYTRTSTTTPRRGVVYTDRTSFPRVRPTETPTGLDETWTEGRGRSLRTHRPSSGKTRNFTPKRVPPERLTGMRRRSTPGVSSPDCRTRQGDLPGPSGQPSPIPLPHGRGTRHGTVSGRSRPITSRSKRLSLSIAHLRYRRGRHCTPLCYFLWTDRITRDETESETLTNDQVRPSSRNPSLPNPDPGVGSTLRPVPEPTRYQTIRGENVRWYRRPLSWNPVE